MGSYHSISVRTESWPSGAVVNPLWLLVEEEESDWFIGRLGRRQRGSGKGNVGGYHLMKTYGLFSSRKIPGLDVGAFV